MSITLTPQLDNTLMTRDGETAVDARSLHAFLENGDEFLKWFRDRLQQYGFIEGIDYVGIIGKTPEKGKRGRPTSADYALTIDMAKELCMVERNAKGKEARLYFISMEKKAKALSATVPQSLPEALRLAADLAEKIEKQDAKILELAPKAEFYEKVADAVDSVGISDFAKSIGTGEYRMFKWLRDNKYIFKEGRHNKPYQKWIEQGYFKLKERAYTDENGETHTYFRVLITGKGQIRISTEFKGNKVA